MGRVSILESTLTAIADAIRTKLSSEDTYKPSEMADAIGEIGGGSTPTGTKNITANGTNIDVAQYAYADVAVPNSYSAGDEGKVVSNGALVSQTSDTVTTNNTYDTTLINSLTVNVSGGGSANFATGTFTPESSTNQWEIDTGGNYDHLVLYTDTISAGYSIRALRIAETDLSGGSEKSFVVSTNNSGASVALDVDYTTGAFSKSGTKFTYSRTNTKLVANVVHRWIAW